MMQPEYRATAIANTHKNLVKIRRVFRRHDRVQTNTHTETDTLITILGTPYRGRSNNLRYSSLVCVKMTLKFHVMQP